MESFAVTCPLAPDTSHLRSGSCTSPRAFGLSFLQTSPHDDALALLLAFGSAITWQEDLHLLSSVPCPAHTLVLKRVRLRTSFAAHCWARCHTAFAKVFAIRVCQPGPVAFQRSITTGSIRNDSKVLAGFLPRPRCPGERTVPLAQNASTDDRLLGLYGASDDRTRLGARAIAAFTAFALVGNEGEVVARFMSSGLSKGDNVDVVAALGVSHVHDATLEPAEQIDALLAVDVSIVFRRHHRMIENRLTVDEVELVFGDVLQSLGFVKRDHASV